VLALIRRARRRLFYNALLAQGANTASAALLAFILLLLLGAEILDWQWLVLIPAAAAGTGFWLARRRLPSPYRVAQIIDHRLSLADTLSTALFFRDPDVAAVNLDVKRLQAEAAERMAATVDVRQAVPFTMPRTVYARAALLLVASSLFALRYAVSRRLDLKPPLAALLEQSFGEKTQVARNLPRFDPENVQPQDRDPDAAEDREAAAAGDETTDQERTESTAEQKKASADAKKQAAKGQEPDGQQDGQQSADDSRQGSERAGNQGDSNKQGSKNGNQGNSKQDGANNAGENSSLVSKLKDALQNLLSRMNPRDGQSGSQQQASDQQNQQGNGQQKGGKQQSAKNGQQKSGQPQSDSQSDSSQQSEDSQQAGDKGAGNSDARQSSKQPGSGVGSQNGDKDIKQAEQLAAMGKISEIIGKRQQNITGETTVEVQASTTQALRTPYAQRGAQHTESNADVSRDEIPAALQPYVEQYFEQVRKPAAKK
jgi:hypothetical protein